MGFDSRARHGKLIVMLLTWMYTGHIKNIYQVVNVSIVVVFQQKIGKFNKNNREGGV